MRRTLGAIGFVLSFSLFALAGENVADCPAADNYQQPHRFGAYVVQIVPGPPPQGKQRVEFRCLGTITPAQGVRKAIAKNWTLSLNPISGTDINGDGKPEVVFDGHTSGSHCCYEYWIASLSKPPRLVREIRSEMPVSFQVSDSGALIRVPDAAFQFFMLPPEEGVVPTAILRLEGNRLVDVSSQHQAEYDEAIAKAKAELAPDDLEKFRHSSYNTKLFTDQLLTVKRVLTIVLDYLYSGREEQAWQALEQMWPASDQARVKAIILERRTRGVLSQLLGPPKP